MRIFKICVLQVHERRAIREYVVFPKKYHHFGATMVPTWSQFGPTWGQLGANLGQHILELVRYVTGAFLALLF